jgi:hypothetical protein
MVPQILFVTSADQLNEDFKEKEAEESEVKVVENLLNFDINVFVTYS